MKTIKGIWQDYLEHPWARKMVAAGIGLEMVAIAVWGALGQ
jgi:succinate dehydrogenase hydrophobic anchor subunit